MKPGKHLFIVLLITVVLLFSFLPVVVAQEQLGDPVNICQSGMDADCDLKITDSRDHVTLQGPHSQDISSGKRSDVLSHLNSLHVPFIANQGQVDKGVKFYAKTFGGTLFVTDKGEIVYSLSEVEGNMEESQNGGRKHFRSLAIREELIGAKVNGINGEGEAITKVGYFKGNDPSKWKSGISTYGSVSLGEVYKGIELNLKAYGNNVEKLFYVNPGADPKDIRLKLNGASEIKVNNEGELEVATELGSVKFTRPVAYQEKYNAPSSHRGEGKGEGEKEFIEVAYVVDEDSYSFRVGDYDKTRPVIIDPLLAATFIGGGNSDYTYSIAIDASGNVYVTGLTYSSDYPTTAGAYDISYNGGSLDMFISKLSSDLSTLLSSTFIGGVNDEPAYSIAIDTSGSVYVTGNTSSSDYPTTAGAYDSSYNGGNGDVFVSRLSSDLSTLLSSTFIGGSSGYEGAWSLAINTSGDVYVTGRTMSSDYPTTAGAYDTSLNGYEDVFVSRLSSDLSSLLSSTFIGGSGGSEEAYSLAIDASGNVYITGSTGSSDYPVTPGAYDTSPNGNVFISRLSSDLSALLSSTFIGGGYTAFSIAINTAGDVYVTGWTYSSDYPTTAGAYDTSFNGGFTDVYISRLSSDLSTLLSSTFIGGSDWDRAFSLAINTSGDVYVTGDTFSSDYPTTAGAYDTSLYNFDVFISRLSSDLSTLLSSTFIGGSTGDQASSIVIDTSGNVYVTGNTESSDYPTTVNAYDTSFNGGYSDAFISKIDATLSAADPPIGNGTLVQSWATRYDSGNWDYGDCLALDGSGNVYVAGGSSNGINSDIVTVKYNASGAQLWASSYNNGYGDDFPGCPEVDASGNVYVAGSSSNGSNYDIVTLKYDTNGNLLWAKRYDNGYGDERGSVTVDSSGNVYVAGSSSNGSNNDIVLLKYNSSGTQLWTQRYNNGYEEWATQLVLDGSGNIYVTGDSSNGSNYDIVMLKYDSNGTQLWVRRYDNGGEDSPGWAIAADGAGNVYVTGQSNSDFITIKYNSSGTQLWARSYDNGGWDRAVSLALDGSGNVYVSGESYNGIDSDIVTVKYDYIGTQLWVQRYDSGGDDGGGWGGNRNAVDSVGNVYVMGNSYNGSNYDIITLKYDTYGAQMGIARYDNGGDDSGGYKVAVDTSGNVYLTGSSYNGSNYDFVTVKYSETQTTGDVSRIIYLSTRSKVETGDNRMIGGFIVEGSLPKTLLIRARGPSMTGVSGVLANPNIRLFSHDPLVNDYIAQNDNWGDQSDPLCAQKGYVCGSAADIINGGWSLCPVGDPTCDTESAILITLPPGTYSAVMSGVGGTTGVGLVQISDVDTSTQSKLSYISTRSHVLTSFDRMIGGFIIGSGGGNRQILIRARGPSMTSVSGVLANPYIRLFSHDPLVNDYIAQNDNWGDQSDPLCAQKGYVCGSAADIINGGMALCPVGDPTCDTESAILITLPPGTYSAVMSGVGGTTGVGLVQISDVVQ